MLKGSNTTDSKNKNTEQIRLSLLIRRNIIKYKASYPTLYKVIEEAKKTCEVNSWAWVTPEVYAEYLLLITQHLTVRKFPNSNRKVWVTTHDGGKFVGFYENGKWWYNTCEGSTVEVTAYVIRWKKH